MKSMNQYAGFKLFCVGLMAAVFVPVCPAADVYRVSEVLRVTSPIAFECRLENFPHAKQARFRVSIRGAAVSQVRSREESVEALGAMLTSAERIELRNVTVRNYFRLEADVWTASENIRPALAAGQFIRETPLNNAASQPASKQDRSERTVPRVSRPAPSRSPQIMIGAYDLHRLMKTRIDASSLRAETPLAEALEQISGSLEPRLPMVVFWSDLQANAFVDKETAIGVDGFGVMPAAQALDIVLYSVSGSGMPLKFTIDGGVLKIGTLRSLSGKVTRVYSVTDLLMPGANFDEDYRPGTTGSGGGTGASGRRY